MKKTHLILGLILPFTLFGQSVITIPNTENYNQNGIVYNNSLFFSKNKKLAQFDGASVVTLPDPIYNGNAINGEVAGTMVIYNNKLCYNYDYKYYTTFPPDVLYKDYMITYDGAVQNAILNMDAGNQSGIFIDDNGSVNEPIISGGKLFLKGAYYTGSKSNLYIFDGQSIVKINNVNNESNQATGDVKLGDWALDYNNELYFGYQDYNMTWPGIAKFNGTSIVRLNTDNSKEYWGSIFILNNKLFFKINYINESGGYGIGNYDPLTNTMSKITTPTLLSSGAQKPLVYNSKALITVGEVKLSVFDGVTVNQIANVAANDKGIAGKRVLFGNNIYFPYLDSNNKYFLGKYNGTGISLVPNPSAADAGVGKSLIEFNGGLFFTYSSNGINYLAKYDEQSITVLPNPDSGQGVQDSKFVVYGNDLYFPYKNAAGVTVLAKYGSTVLGTQDIKKKSKISVFKNNDAFSVISEDKEIRSIEVIDATGRVISNEEINKKNHNLAINNSGVFIIKVTLKDGEVYSQKIRN